MSLENPMDTTSKNALARIAAPISVRPSDASPTLAELVPRFIKWLALVRERAPHTLEAYGYDLESFVGFSQRVGLEWPSQVTLHLIEAYLAWLRHERRLSPATANRHRAALRAFFTYLKREGHAPSNPVTDTFPVKQGKRLPKYLTVHEQERVLSALAEDASPRGLRDRAIIAVGLFAGLRADEIAHLRLVDLDLESGTLRVEHGKGDKDRELPVVPRLREVLEAYLAIRPQLVGQPIGEMYRRTPSGPWRVRYQKNGKPITMGTHTYSRAKAREIMLDVAPRSPASPWAFIHASERHGYSLKRAGQPLLTRTLFQIVRQRVSPLVGRPVSPHVLRHSFASRLRANGAGIELIKEALGHESITTTTIYAHLATPERRAEIEKFLR